MTDPTTGGVFASYAVLGDVNLAEPNALIGFAGARVAAGTISQELPPGFQRSEFLFEHGFVDRVVQRRALRGEIAGLLRFMRVPELAVDERPAALNPIGSLLSAVGTVGGAAVGAVGAVGGAAAGAVGAVGGAMGNVVTGGVGLNLPAPTMAPTNGSGNGSVGDTVGGGAATPEEVANDAVAEIATPAPAGIAASPETGTTPAGDKAAARVPTETTDG
jgi:acetyl-CoA carboxylase carboxyl transferase subunit beta